MACERVKLYEEKKYVLIIGKMLRLEVADDVLGPGGTFFPMEHLPVWRQTILGFLPLTHASKAIWTSSLGLIPDFGDYIILAVLGALAYIFAVAAVNCARD